MIKGEDAQTTYQLHLDGRAWSKKFGGDLSLVVGSLEILRVRLIFMKFWLWERF